MLALRQKSAVRKDFAGVRPSRHVQASLHDHGVVLVDNARGIVFTANRAGAAIWKALAAHGSVDGIADAIRLEFAISGERARSDAAAFLTELDRAGLLDRGAI